MDTYRIAVEEIERESTFILDSARSRWEGSLWSIICYYILYVEKFTDNIALTYCNNFPEHQSNYFKSCLMRNYKVDIPGNIEGTSKRKQNVPLTTKKRRTPPSPSPRLTYKTKQKKKKKKKHVCLLSLIVLNWEICIYIIGITS